MEEGEKEIYIVKNKKEREGGVGERVILDLKGEQIR